MVVALICMPLSVIVIRRAKGAPPHKSTGPKTKAGRARIAEAQRRRWRLYRERRQLNVVS
jgi:hypothetical protein